jgi:hypothetical protein
MRNIATRARACRLATVTIGLYHKGVINTPSVERDAFAEAQEQIHDIAAEVNAEDGAKATSEAKGRRGSSVKCQIG